MAGQDEGPGDSGSSGGDKHAVGRGRDDHAVKGKGKQRDDGANVGERLLASGTMAFQAMTGGGTVPDARPEQKDTGPGSSSSGRVSTALGEASTVRQTPRFGESLREHRQVDGVSEAYDSFVNAEPQPAPAPPQLGATSSRNPSVDSIAVQEANDGVEVVQLLSLHHNPADFLPQDGDEDGGDDLTSDEVARLRDALFGTDGAGSRNPQWDELLSFMPESISRPNANANSAADTHLLLGTSNAESARSIWLEQWSDVLSSYTDEVWGDLGPLAAAAKREVEQAVTDDAQKGHGSGEAKALGRLRLILAHLRGNT